MKATNPVLRLQGQLDTEVYATDTGYVCITQDVGFDDPSVILIAPQMIEEICKMLHSVKGNAHENRGNYLVSKASK